MQADQKKAKFFQADGDHLTLLAVYEGWKTSKFSNLWCQENYIQSRSMRRAQVRQSWCRRTTPKMCRCRAAHEIHSSSLSASAAIVHTCAQRRPLPFLMSLLRCYICSTLQLLKRLSD